MCRAIVFGLGLLTLVSMALADGSESPAMSPDEQEIIEQILEFQRQIDRLLERLPADVRQRVERRLAAGASPTVEPPLSPPPVPPATPPSPSRVADEPQMPAPSSEPQLPDPPLPRPRSSEVASTSPTEPLIEVAPDGSEEDPAPPPPRRRRAQRTPCNTLVWLDTQEDGKIDLFDRYWRHVYLWVDDNGDGQAQAKEVASAYEHGVRAIQVDLDLFSRRKRGVGEVQIGEYVMLDLRSNGFGDGGRRDNGILMVDATAVARGDGPQLLSAAGEELAGYQAFRTGLQLRASNGQILNLDCP